MIAPMVGCVHENGMLTLHCYRVIGLGCIGGGGGGWWWGGGGRAELGSQAAALHDIVDAQIGHKAHLGLRKAVWSAAGRESRARV